MQTFMMRMMAAVAIVSMGVSTTACETLLGPQRASQASNLSRAALDFAFNSFDAGLYAFDFAMDMKRPAPGTDQAKAIAAAGRKVLAFLNAAETARQAGNAASYDEAFTQALSALKQFRTLLGIGQAHASLDHQAPLTPRSRTAILARA